MRSVLKMMYSKPREIKGLEYDHKFILSSDDILNMAYLPKSVLIIGSGAIGTEWARILHNFGVEVNIVELAEFLVPAADVEISKRLERIYKKNGIKYFLNDMVQRIDAKNVYLKSGTLLQPDFILVAIGRTPVVCKNAVLADVLGDSCGEIQLAHYAIHQAKEYSLKIHFDKTLTPSVIYGEPEIAWVGLREQDVDETYRKVLLPISALGKSWCDDATDGCIKLITKNNLIYGAHIISNEASSLIHILLLAIQKSIPISELKEICYAHPTYAEGIFDILCR